MGRGNIWNVQMYDDQYFGISTISNIEITKDELFDFFIFEFIFIFFEMFKLFELSIYLIIYQV